MKGGALMKRNVEAFATHKRSAENALMFVDGAMRDGTLLPPSEVFKTPYQVVDVGFVDTGISSSGASIAAAVTSPANSLHAIP